MKTLKYILLSCCAATVMSCNDFLVEEPTTSVGGSNVYNSLSTAKAALAGCWGTMDYDSYGFNYFHVVSSTSGLGVSMKATDKTLASMSIPATHVNMTKMYDAQYKTIMVANDIINGMAKGSVPEGLEKNRILGEAHFLRAVSYFNLVRLFGPIPLVTSIPESYHEAQNPRADVEVVYTTILDDLQKAWDLLPEYENRVAGYPYKYAAKAIRAKVYLTLAGNDETSEYWEKAYNDALEVYKNGKYELVRPYSKLFGSENNNNKESIFEVQYSTEDNSGRLTETTFPVGHELMTSMRMEGNSWGKTRPTQLIFDMFDAEDPRREASFVYGEYTNIFETNNKKKNILLYPTKKKEGTANGLFYNSDSEYPAWKKYCDASMTAKGSNANFVYCRFADVIYMLAETANEMNQKGEAVKYLNEILDRAADANANGTRDTDEVYPKRVEETISKEDLRERIFRERLKEFTGECDEWYTIRRRGTEYLKKIMVEHNNHINDWYSSQGIDPKEVKFVYTYKTDDNNVKKNLLMPLPSDEITANEKISQEDQNFGY